MKTPISARDLINYVPADEKLLAQSIYWELRELLNPNNIHRNVLIKNIQSKVQYRSEVYSRKPKVWIARTAFWNALTRLDADPDNFANWQLAANLALKWFRTSEETNASHRRGCGSTSPSGP